MINQEHTTQPAHAKIIKRTIRPFSRVERAILSAEQAKRAPQAITKPTIKTASVAARKPMNSHKIAEMAAVLAKANAERDAA